MRAGHPALLLVDAVSSLGSIDLRHDEWGIDVTLAGSQKGLMLPPGLSFNADQREGAATRRTTARAAEVLLVDGSRCSPPNATGLLPVHARDEPAVRAARSAADARTRKGCEQVFARHRGWRRATRAAVRAWGLTILCRREDEQSPVLTAVMMPDGHDADALRAVALERFNLSLGAGLGRLKGRAFRIGHLGDFNELMLAGTLCGVEMALALAGVPFTRGGVDAAMDRAARRAGRPSASPAQ